MWNVKERGFWKGSVHRVNCHKKVKLEPLHTHWNKKRRENPEQQVSASTWENRTLARRWRECKPVLWWSLQAPRKLAVGSSGASPDVRSTGLKAGTPTDVCAPVFTAALFTTAARYEDPRAHRWTDERRNAVYPGDGMLLICTDKWTPDNAHRGPHPWRRCAELPTSQSQKDSAVWFHSWAPSTQTHRDRESNGGCRGLWERHGELVSHRDRVSVWVGDGRQGWVHNSVNVLSDTWPYS